MTNTETDKTPLELEWLAELFEAHGLTGPLVRGWLVSDGRLPCVTADWMRRDARMGTLAVVVRLEDEREIVEVFPGLGETDDEAIAYAFESFAGGVLHPLLAAIWHVQDADAEASERWQIGGHMYEVFEGPWQARGQRLTCPQLLDRLRDVILAQDLDQDLHWFRCFVGGSPGHWTFEALKDSEEWTAGRDLLTSLPFEGGEGYASLRNFLLLRRCA
ncbi:MAG: DUF6348 family protein [Burkholderiaceae bacterium]|jgi:hypothetical protein|nr:DUF6348 family protein [Burkholderiaceae bacterium]